MRASRPLAAAEHQFAPFPRSRSRPSLHEEIVGVLRTMILEGQLAPGRRIAEPKLCVELGISRTPLREALKVLASEGLVTLMPNRGAVVTEVTVEDIAELFEVMGALEGLVGRLAAVRASDAELAELVAAHGRLVEWHRINDRARYFAANQAIHRRIAELSGNRQLALLYADYADKIRRARYLANMSYARWSESVREHERIMEAFVARDANLLAELLQEHLRKTGAVVCDALRGAATSDRVRAAR